MTTLCRVRSVWSGFRGGPGVTTMYFLDTSTCVEDLHTLWTAINAHLPDDVSIQVENTGDTIESTTGDLVGTWPASDEVAPVVGLNVDAYAAPVGAVVNWLTSTVSDGSRLRGKSYIVPLAGNQFASDGSIGTAPLSDLVTAFGNFSAGQLASFVIWRRPRDAKAADGSRPAVEARAGSHGLVTSVRIPDVAAVLRSRRD